MNISQIVGNTMRGLWSSSGVPTGNKLGWPTSSKNLANKVTTLALATIALYAVANVPQAEAGPLLGSAGYWLTKTVCYVTTGTVGTTVIATTGGAAAMATGPAAAGAGMTIAAAVESASLAVGAFLTALPTP